MAGMMTGKTPFSLLAVLIPACALALWLWSARADEPPTQQDAAVDTARIEEETYFQNQVFPLVTQYCVRCHNADEMKSGVRVDQLTALPDERQLSLLKGMQKQLVDEVMPPAEEPQPTHAERQLLVDWVQETLHAARSRDTERNGSVRRLTVTQYRNTLRDLLGLEENFTDVLPPDGTSKDGFTNQAQTMTLSPLLLEAYFDIASQALDACLVDENAPPVIQNFRVDLGAAINPQPCTDQLILGANSDLLNNADFIVTELQPAKPFVYQPFAMRRAYQFIEGYAGNDTVRGWRSFDSIYHAVFACVRGTSGYPKGEPHQTIPGGLLLRPAIPSAEIFGQSNTYGPMENFKISLRELPDRGKFRVTVRAARYPDGLLLEADAPPIEPIDAAERLVANLSASPDATLNVAEAGVYQVEVRCLPGMAQGVFSLELNELRFSAQLLEREPAAGASESRTPFMVVRLPAGELKLRAHYGDGSRLRHVDLARLDVEHAAAKRFATFEQRSPSLGVYVGLRRDCGSTLGPVGSPRPVPNLELRDFVFEGAIRNFPSPDVEPDNVNYLAGMREIGVRSEYTDGRDMPRLLVASVEFEGPYYDSWPPVSHRNIVLDSPLKDDREAHAREILRVFATRALRGPVSDAELAALHDVWRSSFQKHGNFLESIKDALLVVLTSPRFLFLIEASATPAAEDLDPHELASKLSYFLWNSPPDQQLLDLAASHALVDSLDAEIDRMIGDPRFGRFVDEFAAQWLSLDKFDVVAIDAERYPRLTRDTKLQLRREPIEFVRYLIEQNLPLRNLVQSDFIMANEVVASYYDLAERSESGFRFVPIQHQSEHLGGVLSQAAILAGLSNGRESNPVKRGAWLARKIIAEPPDDPPPNVPRLSEDPAENLTLRQKLERHRNQPGCAKCHAGIDPWGLPLESYDAGGRWKTSPGVDPRSSLPDGTEIADLNGLKSYLAQDRIDRVAFSFLKHVASYAIGRSLKYNELAYLEEQGVSLKSNDYRLRDMLRFVIHSDLFLKK